jgi:hypothetical protein
MSDIKYCILNGKNTQQLLNKMKIWKRSDTYLSRVNLWDFYHFVKGYFVFFDFDLHRKRSMILFSIICLENFSLHTQSQNQPDINRLKRGETLNEFQKELRCLSRSTDKINNVSLLPLHRFGRSSIS